MAPPKMMNSEAESSAPSAEDSSGTKDVSLKKAPKTPVKRTTKTSTRPTRKTKVEKSPTKSKAAYSDEEFYLLWHALQSSGATGKANIPELSKRLGINSKATGMRWLRLRNKVTAALQETESKKPEHDSDGDEADDQTE